MNQKIKDRREAKNVPEEVKEEPKETIIDKVVKEVKTFFKGKKNAGN